MRINRQEAEHATIHEQMILFRVRMDKIEGNVADLFTYNKENVSSNSCTQQMEIDHRNHNVLPSCLRDEFHSVADLIRSAQHYLGLQLT